MSVVFRIHLRHIASGLEQAFDNRQDIADFFLTHDRHAYEGWQNLGKLPAATEQALQEALEGGDHIFAQGDDAFPQLPAEQANANAEGEIAAADVAAIPGVEVIEHAEGEPVAREAVVIGAADVDNTLLDALRSGPVIDPDAPHNLGAAFPTEVMTSAENPLGSQSDASGQPDGVEGDRAA